MDTCILYLGPAIENIGCTFPELSLYRVLIACLIESLLNVLHFCRRHVRYFYRVVPGPRRSHALLCSFLVYMHIRSILAYVVQEIIFLFIKVHIPAWFSPWKYSIYMFIFLMRCILCLFVLIVAVVEWVSEITAGCELSVQGNEQILWNIII